MTMELGNLTLITTRDVCNKSCPFCIAKSAGKIYNEFEESKNEFLHFEDILQKLEDNGIRFNRLVISGNGEPSFYDLDQIKLIVEMTKKHINMFNGIRLHTSGNIFFNEDKFNLFNHIDNIEFNILKISLDHEMDMKILEYSKDYTNTKLFNLANNIKLDIALTDIIKLDEFSQELSKYIKNYPNIKTVRLKDLLCGKENAIQTKWIQKHKLEEEKKEKIVKEIVSNYKLSEKLRDKYIYKNESFKLIYGESGDLKYYKNDFIISNNRFMNYDGKDMKVEEMHELFENKISIN